MADNTGHNKYETLTMPGVRRLAHGSQIEPGGRAGRADRNQPEPVGASRCQPEPAGASRSQAVNYATGRTAPEKAARGYGRECADTARRSRASERMVSLRMLAGQ
jgi:hypothetical protein